MSAHVFIPLLALGSLVLISAVVAVLQPRVWLRRLGGGVLLAAAGGLAVGIFLRGTA